jgi:hypothetical protein
VEQEKIMKSGCSLKISLFKLAFFAAFAYICTPKASNRILDIAQPAP